MKHADADDDSRYRFKSLPVRGRGLKPMWPCAWRKSRAVAPRAGAWIETNSSSTQLNRVVVAPRAGAWIETAMLVPHFGYGGASLPVRGRGLKQGIGQATANYVSRSPCGGVD